MLYLRTIDDANMTHATKSTTNPKALCGTEVGRSRLDTQEQRVFDPVSSTATLIRLPVQVSKPADVDCPTCAAFLAPRKIKAQATRAARKPKA